MVHAIVYALMYRGLKYFMVAKYSCVKNCVKNVFFCVCVMYLRMYYCCCVLC